MLAPPQCRKRARQRPEPPQPRGGPPRRDRRGSTPPAAPDPPHAAKAHRRHRLPAAPPFPRNSPRTPSAAACRESSHSSRPPLGRIFANGGGNAPWLGRPVPPPPRKIGRASCRERV